MNIKNDIDLELLSIKEIAILNVLGIEKAKSNPNGLPIPLIINRINYYYKDVDELQNVKQNYVLNFMRKLTEFKYVTRTDYSPKKVYFKLTDEGFVLRDKAKIALQKLLRGYAGGLPEAKYRLSILDCNTNVEIENVEIGKELKTKLDETYYLPEDIESKDILNYIREFSFIDKLELIRYINQTIEEDNRKVNPSGEIEYR